MRSFQVVIIGSGFGGLTAAINLQKRELNDFIILERRSFMGGTWHQNTYPGAQVDVYSPLYSVSFEPYQWTQMFAEQKELAEYTDHVISQNSLREKTEVNTNVTRVQWSEDDQRWNIETDKENYQAQFIINASGPLSLPVIPDFKGKDSFKGDAFHTNKWNHDCDYEGKKVAVIGSGASAIQVIPAITDEVDHLYVFQRTPHWVIPRPDFQFAKWQRKLLGINRIYQLVRWIIYWSLEIRVIGFKYSRIALKLLAETEAKHHLKKQIKDEALRQKMTPNYTIGCKRVLLSNTFYPTLCKENVSLLTQEQGIEEINETGIITQDGKQIDLDIIVYATGFDATDGVISYPVIGKNKQELQKFWDDYPRAYLGTSIPEFPNLFIVTGPNTGIGHTSAIFVIEAQMEYIMRSIEQTIKRGKEVIEVTIDAEDEYTEMIHHEMKKTVWQNGGCNSWYKSKSGKVIAMFPGFTFTYKRMAKNFNPNHHVFS